MFERTSLDSRNSRHQMFETRDDSSRRCWRHQIYEAGGSFKLQELAGSPQVRSSAGTVPHAAANGTPKAPYPPCFISVSYFR